jgi:hypothetical protein
LRTGADGEIKAFGHDVDHAVAEIEGHVERGVVHRMAQRERRDEMLAKRGRTGYPEASAQAKVAAGNRQCRIALVDQAAPAFGQFAARCRQRDLPGRAVEQGGAGAVFERGNGPADMRGGAPQFAGSGRKSAVFGNGNEFFQTRPV